MRLLQLTTLSVVVGVFALGLQARQAPAIATDWPVAMMATYCLPLLP